MTDLLSLAVIIAALTADDATSPSGAALRAGSTCFEVLRGETSVGLTQQTVRETLFDGKPAWEIEVHQKIPAAAFEMRDRFILSRDDLRPFAFSSERARPGSPMWRAVWLRYDQGRITGLDQDSQGSKPIDVSFDHPVWEGNLWGVTFAGLPLAPEGRYRLPTWHYDQGFGAFEIRVLGRETVATPAGPVDGWRVQAGDGDSVAEYTLDLQSGQELAYRAGPFEQRLGGDCTALNG